MPGPINAAKVSFEVVETLRELDGAGVSEVAERLDRPTSTVHDYLRTLEAEEYLVKEGGEYHVGTRFLQLGEQARARTKPFRIARPEVDDLADQTGEHANLMIEEHGLGVFLYKARGDDAVQLDTHAGMRVPLQTAALGKSIMAHRPREEVDAIVDRHGLPPVTENTITDRDDLFEELDAVRERGYAYDDAERVKGMRCVAAPITDDDGRAIAAVSVSGPESRMREHRFTEEIPELVLRTSNVIEVNLTYS
ncbi:IclR family transcriptional regulator [Candidatus Halobonum tyrrellensis]|uniref:ArcR family transcription regulator n=1 Tax=Candidatus Halobonum tyrrellensis G22 TaxID=1324957 RepID=V4HGQ4_9EURY|nr:IclR family transcriptional regulator [Candidatus Halobonum tyrrellensis]ESP86999.1 ArcR family transcription regulator [Candidatus Halobonum tyrrellensis G22]